MYDSRFLRLAFVVVVLSGSKIVDGVPATNTSATNEANRVASPKPDYIPEECWRNVQGATTKASSEWNGDRKNWGSKRAIEGHTWCSDYARLTQDGNDETIATGAMKCDGSYGGYLTEKCPQWIWIDFAKSTKISYIEFESWSLGSAPTQFKIYGITDYGFGWRMLINQDSPDIPEKYNQRRKFRIFPEFPSKRWFTKIEIVIKAIVDSANNENWSYVTIKNLILCP